MAFANTIHGGAAPSLTTSVYYTGSDTLYEGYALCYDFNAADVNQENATQTSPNVGEECWADARRVLVEKPQEGNKLHFAGAVARESDGVTGPGWVTIHRPGSVCNVYANVDCDHETGTGYCSGQIIGVSVGEYAFHSPCYPGSGAALVLQDVSRATTAGLIMAELMVGEPSGGYCDCSPAATVSGGDTLSIILSMVPVFAGVYEFNDGSATTNGNILSLEMDENDGGFIGQRVMFIGGATLISNMLSAEIHHIVNGCFSTESNAIASAVAEISAANEYIAFKFDGVRWEWIGGHENLSLA